MDENNTTPPPNLPDDNDKNKPKVPFFNKNRYPDGNFDNYKNNKPKPVNHYDEWFEGKREHPQHVKATQPTNVYDEIIEDLIDIVAKLLKELSKRK